MLRSLSILVVYCTSLIEVINHTYEHAKDVPDYFAETIPLLFGLMTLEIIIGILKGDIGFKMLYVFNNVAGIMMQMLFHQVVITPFMFYVYCYVYEHYRLVYLPWDSMWTWYIAFLLVDFAFYWFHRATHEVNFLWAAHQVHHSSEDFNLTTAARQSIGQKYFKGVEQPIRLRDLERFQMENRLETRYVLFHLLITIIVFQEFFARRASSYSVTVVYGCLAYVFGTLTSCGFVLENRWFWYHLEAIRCFAVIVTDVYLTLNSIKIPLLPGVAVYAVRAVNIISLLVTSFYILIPKEEAKERKRSQKYTKRVK